MIIYKIVNNINGKIYIGQTIQTLEKRWKSHCSKGGSLSYIKRAIFKYGQNNFSIFEIDRAFSLEELNDNETIKEIKENVFSNPQYKKIFEVMNDLYINKFPINEETVLAKLDNTYEQALLNIISANPIYSQSSFCQPSAWQFQTNQHLQCMVASPLRVFPSYVYSYHSYLP